MKKILLIKVIAFVSLFSLKGQVAFYDAFELAEYIERNGEFFGKELRKDSDSLRYLYALRKDAAATNIDILNYKEFRQKYRADSLRYVEMLGILKKYLPSNYKNYTNGQTLRYYMDSNPFIKEYAYDPDASHGLFKISGIEADKHFSISSLSGIEVTNIADGLARFMVERAKEELTIAFFERFKKELDNSKVIQEVFPLTHNVLKTIDTEIYQFNAYLGVLRESFQHDLANLYSNLENVLEIEEFQNFFDKFPEIKPILSNSFYIVNQINQGKHPGELIKDYELSRLVLLDTAFHTKEIHTSFQTLQLISESFKSKSADRYWVTADSASLLFNDDELTAFRIYLGLLYQHEKIDEIQLGGESLKTYLNKIAAWMNDLPTKRDNLKKIEVFFRDFIRQAEQIDGYLKEIKNAQDNKLDYNDYYKYFNATIDLFEYMYKIKELPDIINIGINEKYKKHIYVARQTSELYLNVNKKQYNSAFINLFAIVDTLYGKNYKDDLDRTQKLITFCENLRKKAKKGEKELDDIKKDLEKLKERFENRDTLKNVLSQIDTAISDNYKLKNSYDEKELKQNLNKLIKDLGSDVKKIKNFNKLKSLVLKYGAFASSLANAESPEEVQSIIKASVLPAGSYRIKRNSDFTFSVNSYLGANALFEADTLNYNRIEGRYGFYAPVGFESSFGFRPFKKCNKHSVGVFLTMFDIGGLAQYRLNNSDSTLRSEINLGNIWSPGANLTLGLGNLPLTLGGGLQARPQLEGVDKNGKLILAEKSKVFTWHAFIAVDIPLFNVYTKPAKPNYFK